MTSPTMETQLKTTAIAQPMIPAKNMNSTRYMAQSANRKVNVMSDSCPGNAIRSGCGCGSLGSACSSPRPVRTKRLQARRAREFPQKTLAAFWNRSHGSAALMLRQPIQRYSRARNEHRARQCVENRFEGPPGRRPQVRSRGKAIQHIGGFMPPDCPQLEQNYRGSAPVLRLVPRPVRG